MNSGPIIWRPHALCDSDRRSLPVWFAAVGKWEQAGITEIQARSLVIEFFESLDPPREIGLTSQALCLQNAFMSLANGTFETIQSSPQFSRFARCNLEDFLDGWRDGKELQFTTIWEQKFYPGWEAKVPPEVPVRVIENSGESESTAIQIITDDTDDKIHGEYWYLHYLYGYGWRCEMQTALGPRIRLQGDDPHSAIDERRFDVLHIRFSNGHKQKFYFLK